MGLKWGGRRTQKHARICLVAFSRCTAQGKVSLCFLLFALLFRKCRPTLFSTRLKYIEGLDISISICRMLTETPLLAFQDFFFAVGSEQGLNVINVLFSIFFFCCCYSGKPPESPHNEPKIWKMLATWDLLSMLNKDPKLFLTIAAQKAKLFFFLETSWRAEVSIPAYSFSSFASLLATRWELLLHAHARKHARTCKRSSAV